jgi:hypothetical protein
MQSVQRSLLFGVIAGLIFGCAIGAGLAALYIRTNPPVYAGGAYPAEMTENYQDHYLAMVIDSYIVNRQVNLAQERLKTFSEEDKIRSLGRWSATYVANGQAGEAQLVNALAADLNAAEKWNPETISRVGQELTAQYQEDSARVQGITTYIAQLGQVPTPPPAPTPVEGQAPPVEPEQVTPPPAEEESSIWSWLLPCLLALLVFLLLLVLAVRILGRRRKAPPRQEIVWEGEGPPPIKRWQGTYRYGQDNYDEFFTIETASGDFLGESGIGILETVPGSSPKQVVAFDIGLFDKTDITTLSRVLMSEYAYNEESIRAKIEANPQAEAVLAEPGKEFTLETSALRVLAKIEEMAYGGENQTYFDLLTVSLTVFIREGADLKIGTMDVPEEFR